MSERKGVVVSKTYGDGKFPIAISLLDDRVNFYLVWIDSKYQNSGDEDISSFMQDFDDDVWDAIEYEFGSNERCYSDDCPGEAECDECDYRPFPVFPSNYSGCLRWAASTEDLAIAKGGENVS